jgi:hypothetical protein
MRFGWETEEDLARVEPVSKGFVETCPGSSLTHTKKGPATLTGPDP